MTTTLAAEPVVVSTPLAAERVVVTTPLAAEPVVVTTPLAAEPVVVSTPPSVVVSSPLAESVQVSTPISISSSDAVCANSAAISDTSLMSYSSMSPAHEYPTPMHSYPGLEANSRETGHIISACGVRMSLNSLPIIQCGVRIPLHLQYLQCDLLYPGGPPGLSPYSPVSFIWLRKVLCVCIQLYKKYAQVFASLYY